MVLADVPRPIHIASTTRRDRCRKLRLVNQDIDAGCLLDQLLTRPGVAGYDDAAIRSVDAITVGVAPRAVIHPKRANANSAAVVDDARLDLMHRDAIAVPALVFETVRSNADVFAECRVEVLGHRTQSRRPVQAKRLCRPKIHELKMRSG